jgi:hypothetical protein
MADAAAKYERDLNEEVSHCHLLTKAELRAYLRDLIKTGDKKACSHVGRLLDRLSLGSAFLTEPNHDHSDMLKLWENMVKRREDTTS